MELTGSIILLLLCLVRISGIFLMTPVFGGKTIPMKVKVGFSVILSVIVFPLVNISEDIYIHSFINLVYYLVNEILIGLLFGFISMLILNAIYIAGVIVDRNIGFSIVSVMSPQDEGEMPITANLYYLMAMLVFLATDCHHLMIKAMIYSFKVIPLGTLGINLLEVNQVIDILRESFVNGFKISAPIMITIFVSNVLLGILSRAMPQMNIFMVGMPLKIIMGLITLYLLLPLYINVFENMFLKTFDYFREFLSLAVKG